MRFYANENFPLPAIKALRQLEHDVSSTHDVGKSGQAIPDDEVLAFAVLEDRIVLTFNRRDFIRLHIENPDHKGIVVCSFDPDFERLAKRIHEAINVAEKMDGNLIRVNRSDQ